MFEQQHEECMYNEMLDQLVPSETEGHFYLRPRLSKTSSDLHPNKSVTIDQRAPFPFRVCTVLGIA